MSSTSIIKSETMKSLNYLSSLAIIALLCACFVCVAHADDNWNITVQTTAGPSTVPFDSSGLLSLENFTISSECQISNVTFNASISELSFHAEVSAEEGSVSGQNIAITVPESIINNQTLLIYIYVDGKANGYSANGNSTLGFYLYQGSHTVNLDILMDPPAATVPEFSMSFFIVLMLLGSALLIPCLKRNHDWRKEAKAP